MINELKSQIDFKHLKNNLFFFLSSLVFGLMIFKTEKLWVAVSLAIVMFSFVLSLVMNNIFAEFKKTSRITKMLSFGCALGGVGACLATFCSNWSYSKPVIYFAEKLQMNNMVLSLIVAAVLALMALYFLVLLSYLIITELKNIISDVNYEKDLTVILKNLKSNLLLIISAFALLGLNIQIDISGIIALVASYIMIVLIFSQITNIFKKVADTPLMLKAYSFVSTVGICYYCRSIFFTTITVFCSENKIAINTTAITALSWVLALLSGVVVFVCVVILLNYVINTLKGLFASLTKTEIVIYSVIIALLCAFASFSFMKSDAFWGAVFLDSEVGYDILFTSDSPMLVSDNVYLRLCHAENDIRQPLFTVFAAPVIGFGYALSVPFSNAFTAIFMNSVQIVMLVVTNLMIAKMIKLEPSGRICFMLVSTFTYSCLLFSLMMEQYIVAYFWLIFAIYTCVENNKFSVVSYSAAGSTLLTSLVLLPLACVQNKENKLRECIVSIEKCVLGFMVFLVSFGRMDVILNLVGKTSALSRFTEGNGVLGTINQYLAFVSSCFIAPEAMVDSKKFEHISWQLSNQNITHTNILGIIILVLCIISVVVNRKNIFVKISGLWALFSVMLLCVIGWGSAENGMVLYSLYFGWAFLVLLFYLVKWISAKLNFKPLVPIVSAGLLIGLGIFNFNGIKDLLNFAFTHYPF